MNLQELEEFYRHRQSCRNYSDKQVDENLLREIVRIAGLAPSACNAQPWKVVAVTGEKAKPFSECFRSMNMNGFTQKVPAYLVVCHGESNLSAKFGGRLKETDFTPVDVGIFSAHLILAAEAAGLSTCVLGWRDQHKIIDFLSLPKNTVIPHVIAVGYAAEGDPIREKKRKEIDKIFTVIK